jgi:hypothetical protein
MHHEWLKGEIGADHAKRAHSDPPSAGLKTDEPEEREDQDQQQFGFGEGGNRHEYLYADQHPREGQCPATSRDAMDDKKVDAHVIHCRQRNDGSRKDRLRQAEHIGHREKVAQRPAAQKKAYSHGFCSRRFS